MKIVAITGMPGAGKSTVAQALQALNMRHIAMGDMIRLETKRRGLPTDDRNMGAVMRELRERFGAGAVAELTIRELRKSDGRTVVVDGIRSVAEVEAFKREGNVKLLAVVASPKRRYELLLERGRSDDPLDVAGFNKRDERELSIGIGSAIAMADEVVSNEHSSVEQLAKAAVEVVRKWLSDGGSN